MKQSGISIGGALLCLIFNGASAAETHHAHGVAVDTRVVLELTPTERAMILEEMRLFLDGVQKMTGALAKPDMPAVADAARGLGQKMVHEVPPALRAKLPLEFRQLGFSVHREFDQIALDADSLKDVSHSLNQLSDTLKKCVSCHTTYQIQTPAPNDTH
ncbi:hypothetical protein [Thiobacillus sp.]|uniref:hypothetical protein n=1 Tax=Thiobacillus sp. TaxID=924 RepID=UPI00286DFA27|nr:hypothetical protein [Thiobacillus sp.]